ncbi:MAG: hypothetical protein SGJ09_02170 [Phycisphaerae bacterium]|nr:hypothetical protein [Phycisphaerae bacterium]
MIDAPVRIGSLVLFPITADADPTDWSLVVLASERVPKQIVVFADGRVAAVSNDVFTAELDALTQRRDAHGAHANVWVLLDFE